MCCILCLWLNCQIPRVYRVHHERSCNGSQSVWSSSAIIIITRVSIFSSFSDFCRCARSSCGSVPSFQQEIFPSCVCGCRKTHGRCGECIFVLFCCICWLDIVLWMYFCCLPMTSSTISLLKWVVPRYSATIVQIKYLPLSVFGCAHYSLVDFHLCTWLSRWWSQPLPRKSAFAIWKSSVSERVLFCPWTTSWSSRWASVCAALGRSTSCAWTCWSARIFTRYLLVCAMFFHASEWVIGNCSAENLPHSF